jgi:hypothetical protein
MQDVFDLLNNFIFKTALKNKRMTSMTKKIMVLEMDD